MIVIRLIVMCLFPVEQVPVVMMMVQHLTRRFV